MRSEHPMAIVTLSAVEYELCCIIIETEAFILLLPPLAVLIPDTSEKEVFILLPFDWESKDETGVVCTVVTDEIKPLVDVVVPLTDSSELSA